MAVLRLFASIREAAGTNRIEMDAPTPRALIDDAVKRFGEDFERLLSSCSVMIDGESSNDLDQRIAATTEVALLPPVSGGCW